MTNDQVKQWTAMAELTLQRIGTWKAIPGPEDDEWGIGEEPGTSPSIAQMVWKSDTERIMDARWLLATMLEHLNQKALELP